MPEFTNEQELRDAIRTSIAERLLPVCADWPTDTFDAMVERLAQITVKYDVGSGSGSTYDRRSTDRLVAELRELMAKSETLRDLLTPPSGERLLP